MTEEFVRERLTALRLQKNISEYRMSFDLGHSKGYIQSISSGRAMPSMGEFLYICDYLGITPQQFFDEQCSDPVIITKIVELLRDMDTDDLELILSIAKRIKNA
ncbi:MAG: helix-turn-helix domain-containing protein [Oscillospiraceae bacterium]|nr:helix-turn-helix domain-containing protein [Oscillospiraceae bacterium]